MNESPPGAGELNRFDPATETTTRYLHDPLDPDRPGMPHLDEISGPAYVTVLDEDRSGALWIGAISGELSLYDPVADRLVHVKNNGRQRAC